MPGGGFRGRTKFKLDEIGARFCFLRKSELILLPSGERMGTLVQRWPSLLIRFVFSFLQTEFFDIEVLRKSTYNLSIDCQSYPSKVLYT